jgi:hypothetical protein
MTSGRSRPSARALPEGSSEPLPPAASRTHAGGAVGHHTEERPLRTIPTEPEARHAYFVTLGRAGGSATCAKYGAGHYATLGKLGFAVTLGRYGGDFVWRLLRESYLRKYYAPENVAWLCDDCHREKTRAKRRGRWGTAEAREHAVACC